MTSPTPSRRFTHVALAVVVMVSAALGSLALATAPAGADGASDRSAGDFIGLINGLRSSRGLAPLAVDGALAASAQSWTNTMASSNTLAHDPNLASAVSGWIRIGENVGSGGSVSSLWSSFVASPTHLDNILNPAYTHVGVGYLQDSRGVIWTAHRFMATAVVAPPPTAPPPTAPPATTPPAPVVASPAPATAAPVVTAPTTAATPNVATTSTDGASGAAGADGDGTGDRLRRRTEHDPSADPDRVAEVISALRALPA